MNNLEYKGFVGTIGWSDEKNMFYGKIIGIREKLEYFSDNLTELEINFKKTVDMYLQNR